MTPEKKLVDIMEKTISTLETNRHSVISIIDTLQAEHERKKLELFHIKEQLPGVFADVQQLLVLDQSLRQKLANASGDFSNTGQDALKTIFDKATEIHHKLLHAQETEAFLIKRRDALELDLRHSQTQIDQAECMATQLATSLSYLQTGISQMDTLAEETVKHTRTQGHLHYISFLKCIENEKLRIARDLHDGPAQQLASASMRVDYCKNILHTDPNSAVDVLDNLKTDLSGTLSEVRQILFHLNPAPLDKVGLKDAIENLLMTTLDPNQIRIGYSYDTKEIPQSIQTTLYRIAQELITNIKKHAEAKQVVLRLTGDTHFIYMHLLDDGKGFVVPSDLESYHLTTKTYGLSNIATRISELRGTLQIKSSNTTGTLFKIQLPIHP